MLSMVDRRGRKPFFWKYPFGLAVGTLVACDDLVDFASMGHGR